MAAAWGGGIRRMSYVLPPSHTCRDRRRNVMMDEQLIDWLRDIDYVGGLKFAISHRQSYMPLTTVQVVTD